jgi:putative membrane protein
MTQVADKEAKYKSLIISAAILIPVVVTILAVAPTMRILGDFNYNLLPLLNAIFNGSTFIILLLAFWAIRVKNIALHKRLMQTAIFISLLFLLSYITYHAATESTKYGGEGLLKNLYFLILFSHIILAAAIVPLVLVTYVRALSERFDKHRKIARITLPLWLYVTFTGVVVYLMIAPYYPQG